MMGIITLVRIPARNLATFFNMPVRYKSNVATTKHMYDVIVLGGGIIGLATARTLSIKYPQFRICLLDKEKELSFHQSGRNSGVIHSGIYYKPGSLKAKLCVEGLKMMYAYIDEKQLPHKKCGKIIVAVEKDELPRLDALYERAKANNVPGVAMISDKCIRDMAPHCRGLKAILSPETGIVDYKVISLSLGLDLQKNGGTILTEFEACAIKENPDSCEYVVRVDSKELPGRLSLSVCGRFLITCAGLQSDRVAIMSGCSSEPKIIPFRGDYLKLRDDKSHMVPLNIYPVPDPKFPFLGVHFTPRIDGSVIVGPTATLAWKRESYRSIDFSLHDTLDFIFYPGLLRLISKNVTFGAKEYVRSIFSALQVKQLKRYLPGLVVSDVVRGFAGVRAQGLMRDGTLVEDFIFDHAEGSLGKHILHVRNAPSPGATSSMAIANMIVQRAADQFGLPK